MLQISAIATAINELFVVGSKLIALYVEAKKNGWIKDSNSLRAKINDAKTNDERMALARSLFIHEPK
jgi:hypothetical protein